MKVKSLRKVLELECEKGYADNAVIGGLDKFLHRWAGQAVESITTPHLLASFRKLRVDDAKYASLSQQQRKKWISDVFAFLSQLEGTGVEKAEVKPPEESAAPPLASKRP